MKSLKVMALTAAIGLASFSTFAHQTHDKQTAGTHPVSNTTHTMAKPVDKKVTTTTTKTVAKKPVTKPVISKSNTGK